MTAGDAVPSWDFFIAHAGADKAQAEILYDHLAAAAQVFLDSRRLGLGDEWDSELAAAQRRSLITVVLVSSNTEDAYYEREEIAAAIALARKKKKEGRRVVPLYLDADAEPPYGLRLKHSLSLTAAFGLSEAATQLLQLLAQVRPVPAAPASTASGQVRRAVVRPGNGMLHHPAADWTSPVRRNRYRYKVAAFDFDGTLLRGPAFDFSWEAVWSGLGFSKAIQRKLKTEYRRRSAADPSPAGRIAAYRDWCEKTCMQFKSRNLSRDQLREFSAPLQLTVNCRDALSDLRSAGVVVAIISGGIDTFLEDKFPDYRDYTDFVFMNELTFSQSGALEAVRATHFDFQGKAEALELVCAKAGCTAEETVFVGDHFNDEAVMLKAHRAIAYPSKDIVVQDTADETLALDDLKTVLPHILVE